MLELRQNHLPHKRVRSVSTSALTKAIVACCYRALSKPGGRGAALQSGMQGSKYTTQGFDAQASGACATGSREGGSSPPRVVLLFVAVFVACHQAAGTTAVPGNNALRHSQGGAGGRAASKPEELLSHTRHIAKPPGIQKIGGRPEALAPSEKRPRPAAPPLKPVNPQRPR
jgi:hypothetical protein